MSLCSGEGTFLSEWERGLDLLLPDLLVLRLGEPDVRGRTTSVKNVFRSPVGRGRGRERGREGGRERERRRGRDGGREGERERGEKGERREEGWEM